MEDLEPKIDLPGGSVGTTDAHEHLQTNGRTRRPVTAHDQANSELIGSEAVSIAARNSLPPMAAALRFFGVYNTTRAGIARASLFSSLYFLTS